MVVVVVDTSTHFVELVCTPFPGACLQLSEIILGLQRQHDAKTKAQMSENLDFYGATRGR